MESGGFCRSRPGIEHPDIMFHFLPSQVIDHGRKAAEVEAFQVHVGPMRPTSRGYLKLKSKDPRQHPIIDPNYLSTGEETLPCYLLFREGFSLHASHFCSEIDRWELRESIRLSRDIFAQPAFAPFRAGEMEPGASVRTDEQLDAFARAKADSAYHPSCTCAMGDPGKEGTVVDSSSMQVVGGWKEFLLLRSTCAKNYRKRYSVFFCSGLDGLYVVDASVMPSVSSGNLNAPTLMLAERASDLIRGRPPLDPVEVPVYRPERLDNEHLKRAEDQEGGRREEAQDGT